MVSGGMKSCAAAHYNDVEQEMGSSRSPGGRVARNGE